MENTSKNFQSFSCQTKENFNEFLKKNEVKEKAFNFIQLSYENVFFIIISLLYLVFLYVRYVKGQMNTR